MTQPAPWVFCDAWAVAICVPSRKLGPRTYFSVPSWLQLTSGRVGSSYPRRGSSAAQSSACRACACTLGSVLCRVARAWSIAAATVGSAGVATGGEAAALGGAAALGTLGGFAALGGALGAAAGARGRASATGATPAWTTGSVPTGPPSPAGAPWGGRVWPLAGAVEAGAAFDGGAAGLPEGGAPGAGAAGAFDGIAPWFAAFEFAATGPPMTSRNRSCAVWPSDRAWSPLSPGTVIVRLVPSSTTSAPLTPSPLTR